MFFPGNFGLGIPVGNFEQEYHVYSVSFIDKPHLENGDKVVMPPSALDRLASLHIDYPMLFEVHSRSTGRTSHCGVLEFVADEGCVYMPYWMMQNLLLQEGDLVRMRNATLQKGTYVKLQPHTKDFLDISNPKAVLETTLRNFSCLTTGDNIMVGYNNKKYYIDIVETKPARAISIIETDCEVDFAPPLDYVEPPRPQPQAPATSAPGGAGAANGAAPAIAGRTSKAKAKAEPEPPPEEPKFQAFTGSGKRLDGKPSSSSPSSPSPSAAAPAVPSAAAATKSSLQPSSVAARGSGGGSAATAAAPSAAAAGPRPGTRLVFGRTSGSGAAAGSGSPSQAGKGKEKDKAAAAATNSDKNEETKKSFQAFSGKAYSLK